MEVCRDIIWRPRYTEAWLDVVARRGYIMELCERAGNCKSCKDFKEIKNT